MSAPMEWSEAQREALAAMTPAERVAAVRAALPPDLQRELDIYLQQPEAALVRLAQRRRRRGSALITRACFALWALAEMRGAA